MLPKDSLGPTDTGEVEQSVSAKDASLSKHTPKAVRSIQGPLEDVEEADSSGGKGSEFQAWADQNAFNERAFHGQGYRLTLRPEDNKHLDDLGNGVGLTKAYRQSDSFIDDYGEIYELKAGYLNGGIDEQQAYEYSLMQEAGKVYSRSGDGALVEVPVKGVTYIFDSKEGARANRSVLDQYGFGVLYRDDQGKLLQLRDE